MNWYIYRIQVGLHVYVLEYIIYNMGVGELFFGFLVNYSWGVQTWK